MCGSKRSVAGRFGRVAAGYDQVGFFHLVARRLLTLAGVRHGMRVLDVACGSGAVLVPAASLVGPAGLAVGIDLAEPMAGWPPASCGGWARVAARPR